MAKNHIKGNPEGQHSGTQGDGPKPGGASRGQPPGVGRSRPTGNKGTATGGGGGGRMKSTGNATY